MRNRRVDLHGKHIVVTGASSGIGRALAMALADKGAILVLAARRRELLDGVAAEIEAEGHQRPIVIDTDLSAAGAAESLGKAALCALGGAVHVVINNAGANVTGPQSLIGDSAQARALFEVNVWSPLALTATLTAVDDDCRFGNHRQCHVDRPGGAAAAAGLLRGIESGPGPGNSVASTGAGRNPNPSSRGGSRLDRHGPSRYR